MTRDDEAPADRPPQLSELLRMMWSATADGLCVVDRETRIRFANPALARILGCPSADGLLGTTVLERCPPELLEDYQRRFRETIVEQGGEGLIREIQLLRDDGSRVLLNIRHTPLRRQAGTLHAFWARDVSEPLSTEQRMLQDLWPALWVSIEDGVAVNDGAGRFVFVSPSYCRLLGRSAEELVGRSFLDVLPEDHGLDVASRYFGQEELQSGMTGEFELLRKDGRRIFVNSRHTLLRVAGQVFHAFVVRDVTEQRALEQQLLHADRVRALGTLAGGVAHEFNNLLVSILGYAEMIVDRAGPGAEVLGNYARKIQRAARRGTKITGQLLPFARKEEFRKCPIDLHRVLAEVGELFQVSAGSGVRLSLELEAPNHWVMANAIQLNQVFINLLINGQDAMPDGGRLTIATRQVLSRQSPDGEGTGRIQRLVQIDVIDAGCGMDEEIQRRVFEPFFTTKETGKGTGLGMALVYSTVASHGGSIRLDSAPGRGTTVSVTLPSIDPVAR